VQRREATNYNDNDETKIMIKLTFLIGISNAMLGDTDWGTSLLVVDDVMLIN